MVVYECLMILLQDQRSLNQSGMHTQPDQIMREDSSILSEYQCGIILGLLSNQDLKHVRRPPKHMEEIHDSVKHFKFHVLNTDIILITEIKVSTKLFFKQTQECRMSFGRKVSEYSLQHLKLFIFSPKSTAGNSNTCIEMLKARKLHPSVSWQDCCIYPTSSSHPLKPFLRWERFLFYFYVESAIYICTYICIDLQSKSKNRPTKSDICLQVSIIPPKNIFFSVEKSFYLKFCGLYLE